LRDDTLLGTDDFKRQGAHYASGTMKAIWDNHRAVEPLHLDVHHRREDRALKNDIELLVSPRQRGCIPAA